MRRGNRPIGPQSEEADVGLESATYIADLVETNPLAGDPKNQGDDHVRLIKSVLKNSFPDTDLSSGIVLKGATNLPAPTFVLKRLRNNLALFQFGGLWIGTWPNATYGYTLLTLPVLARPAVPTPIAVYYESVPNQDTFYPGVIEVNGDVNLPGGAGAPPVIPGSGLLYLAPLIYPAS